MVDRQRGGGEREREREGGRDKNGGGRKKITQQNSISQSVVLNKNCLMKMDI